MKAKKKPTKVKTATRPVKPSKPAVKAKAKASPVASPVSRQKKGPEIATRPRRPPAVVTSAHTRPAAAAALGGGVETRAGAASRGKYVYCVIRSTQPQAFGAIGLGDEPADVHTVNYKDLAAVVSDTPMGIHDP